ncbi:MAG: hypothetical protein AAAFM81_04530 [Pseudomonadota bacterium]
MSHSIHEQRCWYGAMRQTLFVGVALLLVACMGPYVSKDLGPMQYQMDVGKTRLDFKMPTKNVWLEVPLLSPPGRYAISLSDERLSGEPYRIHPIAVTYQYSPKRGYEIASLRLFASVFTIPDTERAVAQSATGFQQHLLHRFVRPAEQERTSVGIREVAGRSWVYIDNDEEQLFPDDRLEIDKLRFLRINAETYVLIGANLTRTSGVTWAEFSDEAMVAYTQFVDSLSVE